MTNLKALSMMAFVSLLFTGCAASQTSENGPSDSAASPSIAESILDKCDLPESKVIELDDGDSAQFMISGKERSSEDTVGISIDDMHCVLDAAGVRESTFTKSRIGDDMVGDSATVTFTEGNLFQVVPNE